MSETYDLLVKRREEIRDWIAKAQADLNDVETALAAIGPRQEPQPAQLATPPAPETGPKDTAIEREDCPQCGQTTTRDTVLGGSWIHEATGLISCQTADPAGQTRPEGVTR